MPEATYTTAAVSVAENGRDTITLRKRGPESVRNELVFAGHIQINVVMLPKPMWRAEAEQYLMSKGLVAFSGKRRVVPWSVAQLAGIQAMLPRTATHRPLE